MHLNWISPLPPAATGIATYVRHVLPALSSIAEVTLWSEHNGWDKALEEHAEVRRWPEPSGELWKFWSVLNRGDMTVYHLGNNLQFHQDIWRVSRLHPGLVVLHDTALSHFFHDLYLSSQQDPAAFSSVMRRFYGCAGEIAALRLQNSPSDPMELAERFPLIEHAAEGALGVLVHTRDALERLKASRRWATARAALPFAPTPLDEACAEPLTDGPLRLIVFGHVGLNRRLREIFQAMATLTGRIDLKLDVYGEILNRKEIEGDLTDLALKNRVRLHGFVDDPVLSEALRRSDVAINLRYPQMGEASLTQLMIWDFCLPSLVTLAGWFSELPAGTMLPVRLEHEVEDICTHLTALAADPRLRREIGLNGRRYLESEHDPMNYVRSLVELAECCLGVDSTFAAFRLAESLGQTLAPWPRSLRSAAGLRGAKAMMELFGAESPTGSIRGPLVRRS